MDPDGEGLVLVVWDEVGMVGEEVFDQVVGVVGADEMLADECNQGHLGAIGGHADGVDELESDRGDQGWALVFGEAVDGDTFGLLASFGEDVLVVAFVLFDALGEVGMRGLVGADLAGFL